MIANTKNLSVSYDRLLRKINSSQQQEALSNQENNNPTYASSIPYTVQYPSAMPSHNSGVLVGIHPNPPGFYPHSFDSMSTNSRRQYSRTQEPCNK